MRVKHKYKGMFKLKRDLLIMYCYAYTERQAWLNFCRRISNKHGVNIGSVMDVFNGERENYEITIEMEFVEAGGE